MDDRASVTAQRVALRRAAHQLMDEPLVHADPLAIAMLGPEAATALRADPGRDQEGPLASYLRAFLAVRSRIAEDELARAHGRGVRTYVVLGAGLDTFAYRNPHAGLRVIEVDHPASQVFKRGQLARSAIEVPAGVTFAPIDFESQALADVLSAAGLAPGEPCFFSWLGVTPYLERASVVATLAAVAPFAAGGGGIVFDYAISPDGLAPDRRAAFELLAARVRAAGEPFRSFFTPEAIDAELAAQGFTERTDFGHEQLNANWFAGRADGLRVGSLGRIMVALA